MAQGQEGDSVQECAEGHRFRGGRLLFQRAASGLRNHQRQEELGNHHGRLCSPDPRAVPRRNEEPGRP